MKKYDIVIIGGSAGGIMTALSARNTYPDKSVLVIRKEKIVMVPCGIPYVFNSLDNVEENIIPDSLLEKNKIDLIIDEVTEADAAEKTVKLRNGQTISYDKLILAIGSKPRLPIIPGIDKKGVYTIPKDADYLKVLKDEFAKAEKITIVGGGFIGLEVADELLKAGKKVKIVEMMNQLLPNSFDKEYGEMVEEILRNEGAEIFTSTKVTEIKGGEKAEKVVLDNGKELDTDIVIMAAGYEPNTDLAEKMGLNILKGQGIIIDEYMRTSKSDVFALGDCTVKRDFLTGCYTNLMLASTAIAQGRLVGSNLYSIKVIKQFNGVLGTFSTKIGGTTFASVGLNEKMAERAGVEIITGVFETVDRHPGKLPGAHKQKVKLIFAKHSHILLGAQLCGGDSVGEMINMLSVMIQNKMSDIEIDTLQFGTHPMLTASPIAYPVVNATANAIQKWFFEIK